MKVIAINGIGNADPGWTKHVQVRETLGIQEEQLIEFVYEDLMEKNWLNQLLVWSARIAAVYYAKPAVGIAANYVQDYVNDILMYFVVPGVRKKILNRLANVLRQNPNAIVIGFSLGSVVAYETIKNYPGIGGKPVLITIWSTLGSPPLERLVKQFLKISNRNRPVVTDWFNIYSSEDILSGYIDGLGCEPGDQFPIKSFHHMQTYLKAVKSIFSPLFS